MHCSFLASREHTRREQQQREDALKQQVGELQIQIQAKERSYQRLHSSLRTTTELLRSSNRWARTSSTLVLSCTL